MADMPTGLLVGLIESVEPLASKLFVLSIDVNEDGSTSRAKLTIVTNATNCEAGRRTVVAPVGCDRPAWCTATCVSTKRLLEMEKSPPQLDSKARGTR